MAQDNFKSVGALISPQRERENTGNLMQGVIELPVLEESLFNREASNAQGMRDHNFPAELIFSPMYGGCSNELSSFKSYEDLVPPAKANVSAINLSAEKSLICHQAQYHDVLSNAPLKKNETKLKPKTKRTRKRRRTRKKATASQPRDLTPRICTAPLCGTVHASVDDLRIHIENCHPTMRMRC